MSLEELESIGFTSGLNNSYTYPIAAQIQPQYDIIKHDMGLLPDT